MGGLGAVRCNFPSTAYESNTVHPRLVAKSKANICTGTHSTHQDRGDHRKENKFNEVVITITNGKELGVNFFSYPLLLIVSAETNFKIHRGDPTPSYPRGRRRRIYVRTATAPPAYNSIPTQEIVRSQHIHRMIDRYHLLGCVLSILC